MSENLLQLLGAFIGYAVARVAYQGYVETRSPTLLRLTLSFALLGGGFLVLGVSGFAEMGVIPIITYAVGVLIVLAYVFETVGYFFLAFSHVLNVRSMIRVGFMPALIPPLVTATAALKSVSLYFLLYCFAETALSYKRLKNPLTFMIATALGLIAIAEFTRWVSLLYPTEPAIVLISMTMKVIGFFLLYAPVVKFSLKHGVE